MVQFFSSLGTSQGYDWIDTFDTISVAYHQKVAKDRATKEGLVVNPPDEKNLPGQDPVTYASEVQDVLIPYTTKTDTYNYYEVRNYVNDVNQEHAQVLQTYDDQMQARETYTYGNGRTSYLNHQTGDSYQYLTNQSGSVTGLTKDGQAVASTSYNLYGSTKENSDETGNPFAYNGEARDVTGLDYLRARYYDSQVGTFLTEDSYSGELTDPLSQNLYTYVQNNPVNYTDPSGHLRLGMLGGGGRRKTKSTKVYPIFSSDTPVATRVAIINNQPLAKSIQKQQIHAVRTGQPGIWNPTRPAYSPYLGYVQRPYTPVSPTSRSYQQYSIYRPIQTVQTALQRAQANGQSTYNWGKSKSKEAGDIHRNWTKALEETIRHVCNPKTAKGKDGGQNKKPKISVGQFREIEEATRHGLTVDQKKRIDKMTLEEYLKAPPMTAEENTYASRVKFKSFNQLQRSTVLPALAGELSGWNNARRVWTGKDPITGKKANRWLAGGELVIDLLTSIVPVAKAGKIAKVAKAAEAVDDASDVAKAAKAVDKVDDVSDITKAGMGVGNPVPILGKGSTGRVVANTLEEQLAMKEVMSNPLANAFEVPINMTDSRWLGTEGWVKMQRVVTLSNGTKINIHYVYNKITGVFDDFKFK